MKVVRTIILALTWALTAVAWAGPGLDPVEALSNSGQEARARALFKELRCVVCQSESLDDSEADLAHDMRRLVRDLVAQGKTDRDIRNYMAARYGDFVLLNTPQRPSTWPLWFGPFGLLAAVGVGVGILFFGRKAANEPPLAPDEAKALAMLRDESANGG